MSTCLPLLLEYVEALGHAVFTNGTYNLNIIGIRTPDDDANKFNDRLCVVYKDELGWVTRTWPITTDPGTYWRENPMRVTGTAILVPGQYRGAYKIGKHRGKYDALVQRGGRVRLYRDANKDDILDMEPENIADPTYAGINIHRASSRDGGSEQVDRWSAGCQVFADPDDFDAFMELVRKSAAIYGPRFTYTLVPEPMM
ncbi:MAG: hypothetical protein QF464_01145 [Myxococcota bacterium]|nr:hypothetical protein [Myxococcota bacterium]